MQYVTHTAGEVLCRSPATKRPIPARRFTTRFVAPRCETALGDHVALSHRRLGIPTRTRDGSWREFREAEVVQLDRRSRRSSPRPCEADGSGVGVSVLLRQPHGFEGVLPLVVQT